MVAAINPEPQIEVFLSAGEASGDAYAARLVESLRADWDPEVEGAALKFTGLAGVRTRQLGVPLIQNTSDWGAIGITQSARNYLKVLGSFYRAKYHFRKNPPGLFIPIDFGFVNIKFARHAKNHGWKVLYFVPPGSWRRDRQGKDLPFLTDAIATPFEWSERMLKEAGANVYWFGHPIKQLIAEQRAKISADCSRDHPQIAVLPGSREHELEANIPLIARVVETLDYPLEVALTPNANPEEFRQRWKKFSSRPVTLTVGQTANILLRSTASLVCSGTATLESALCECPMVVIYEVPKILKAEMKVRWFKRPKFISLPNIMLDRGVVPEHVEVEGISADLVRSELLEILQDGKARQAQLDGFAELNELLGPPDAVDRTAHLAIEMLRKML